jgi:ribonucleotide reductase beta subunit family protein with ferritin-like domain
MRDCAHKYEHLCESCGEIDPETDDNICYDCVQAKELKEQAKRIAKANEEAKAVLIAQGNKTPTNIQILKQRKLMESKGGL